MLVGMGSPYRELPKYLLCPRCSEMLSRELEGVSPCPRCEGLWLATSALSEAFGSPRWPAGQAMWWRNSLECPACGFEGKQTQMAARMAEDVLVDQCAEHGLWLDRGELGRLMGASGDELAALRDRMNVVAPALEKLGPRREQWRADLETRRRIAAEYRHAQEEELRRRTAATEAERVRGERAPEPRRPSGKPSDPAPDAAANAYHDAGARRAARFQVMSTQRAQVAAEIGRLESQLGVMREHVQRLDAELTRTRHRAMTIERELDASRERMRLLDGDQET